MRRPFDDVVTLGFGTAVTIWVVASVLAMPPLVVQGWVLGLALLVMLLGGGVVGCADRYTRGT